jgi:glycosyltransferase involved in cell wall biosynthesis
MGARQNGSVQKFTIISNGLSMIEMNARVTIGLCVKNGARVVKTAFDSISIQDYPHELLKLVIVDDCSSDNTLSLAMEFAQKTDIKTFVIRSKGEGLGAARQIAVDNAEGDYLLWVDDDLVLTTDYVKNQVKFMDENPNVGAAKGMHIAHSNESLIGILGFEDSASTKSLKQIGTGGAIFRLKAIKKIHGFDNRIKGAGEDLDVSRRIREAGWTLASNSSARVNQKDPPRTVKALWKSHFGYGCGNHFLYHKFKDRSLLLAYYPPIALLGGVKDSCKIYSKLNKKKVFLIPLYSFFISIAVTFGFIQAHIDGYGHN